MLTRRLIDSLYTEAMLLADEARAYFDGIGRGDFDGEAMDRVLLSCESLKVTTRLMHVIAWLLTQRAIDVGEMMRGEQSLSPPVASEQEVLDRLPVEARAIIAASIDLYRRVAHVDAAAPEETAVPSPALHLLHRLRQSL